MNHQSQSFTSSVGGYVKCETESKLLTEQLDLITERVISLLHHRQSLESIVEQFNCSPQKEGKAGDAKPPTSLTILQRLQGINEILHSENEKIFNVIQKFNQLV
jgi:hypothetical protein